MICLRWRGLPERQKSEKELKQHQLNASKYLDRSRKIFCPFVEGCRLPYRHQLLRKILEEVIFGPNNGRRKCVPGTVTSSRNQTILKLEP